MTVTPVAKDDTIKTNTKPAADNPPLSAGKPDDTTPPADGAPTARPHTEAELGAVRAAGGNGEGATTSGTAAADRASLNGSATAERESTNGAAPVDHKAELRARVEARMQEMQEALARLGSDPNNKKWGQDLQDSLQVAQNALSGGWERVGEVESAQLARWLDNAQKIGAAPVKTAEPPNE